uniref:Uncharacterized protein n=1 Tax=Anguilla anguilla TaxID=7936 RepID=A0A0E9PE53_ANGAN
MWHLSLKHVMWQINIILI